MRHREDYRMRAACLDSPEPLHPGEEAMRDLFVGLIVALFIAGFMVYVYEPALFHVWLHRLLY